MFESQLEDSIVLKTGAAVGVGVGGKYVWFGALAQSCTWADLQKNGIEKELKVESLPGC